MFLNTGGYETTEVKGCPRLAPETKCVTSAWFPEDETEFKKVDTWDGTMACLPDADKKQPFL